MKVTLAGRPRCFDALAASVQLLDGPLLPRLAVLPHRRRRESVESLVEGGVHGDELALQVGRQLRDHQAVARHRPGDLVAIGLRLGGLGEIEEPRVPGGDLHALVAQSGRPAADRVEGIERGGVARELRQEQARAFHRRGHRFPLCIVSLASAGMARLGRNARRDAAFRFTPVSHAPRSSFMAGFVAVISTNKGGVRAYGLGRVAG